MMNLFHVQCAEFDDFAIFADDHSKASRLAAKHLQANSAKDPNYMIGHPVSLLHLTFKECRDLKSAAAMNVAGLGLYDAQQGWKIVPVAQHSLAAVPSRGEKQPAKRRLKKTIAAIGQTSEHPSYAASFAG